jgi:hypothetical protein
MVHEAVGARARESLRHDRVEARGVNVAGHSDGPAFVGGVDDPVERLGGVFPDGQQADVIDLCGYPHRSTSWDTWNSTGTAPNSSSRS